MGFEVFVPSAYCFCVFTNEGSQSMEGGGKCELNWPGRTYQQAVEDGEDVFEKVLGRHDGSKSMTRDAVTLGKREQMDDCGPPIPVL